MSDRRPIKNYGNKQYIGDAVYADFDGNYLIVTTEDGISSYNEILFEPEVFKALVEYVGKLNTPRTRF